MKRSYVISGCSYGRREVIEVGSQIKRLGLLCARSSVIGSDVSCDLLINGCELPLLLLPAEALSHLGW